MHCRPRADTRSPMSDDNAPTQSALYLLAHALLRTRVVEPDDMVEAARAVEREGARDDPYNKDWDGFAHSLRLAARDLDAQEARPKLGVIDGGKA